MPLAPPCPSWGLHDHYPEHSCAQQVRHSFECYCLLLANFWLAANPVMVFDFYHKEKLKVVKLNTSVNMFI